MDLSNDEIEVLKKVNFIKHSDRTKKSIVEALEGVDPKVFTGLFQKKILFEYKKEGNELIGIDKNYFSLLNEGLIDKLFSKGFLVLTDDFEIKKLNNQLIKSQKQTQVKGVKAFDGKLYVITLDKFNEVKSKLDLSKEKTVEEVSDETGFDLDLCRAVVEVLKENGEVIEKTKDRFVVV